MEHPFIAIGLVTFAALILGAGLLHLVGKLGGAGKAFSEVLCRAPGLDLVITYFTALPMIAGPIAGATLFGTSGGGGAWWGLLGAIAGQVLTVMVWTVLHEMANRRHLRSPRVVHALNRSVGRVRNHAAVWWTALAVPVFWIVRVAEWIVYPPLIWLVRFPRYNQGEWVNVSRHKFSGLVGHDLIWCLYCDWMTGVWSLGTEMLRNVESFWCPIRFDSAKKCENCAIDFPDLNGGWVPASSDTAHASRVLDEKYPPGQKVNAWFGHPARLTVKGEEPSARG